MDPLRDLDMKNILIIRHFGSQINFNHKKITLDQKGYILEKISIDTLRAINMSGNKTKSLARGLKQTSDEMKALYADEDISITSMGNANKSIAK